MTNEERDDLSRRYGSGKTSGSQSLKLLIAMLDRAEERKKAREGDELPTPPSAD